MNENPLLNLSGLPAFLAFAPSMQSRPSGN